MFPITFKLLPMNTWSLNLVEFLVWSNPAWNIGLFENGVLHMYTIEGVSTVANFITAYEESQ